MDSESGSVPPCPWGRCFTPGASDTKRGHWSGSGSAVQLPPASIGYVLTPSPAWSCEFVLGPSCAPPCQTHADVAPWPACACREHPKVLHWRWDRDLAWMWTTEDNRDTPLQYIRYTDDPYSLVNIYCFWYSVDFSIFLCQPHSFTA